MTTSVIASIAMGYHEKLGRNVLPLLRTPDFFILDMHRFIHEHGKWGLPYSPDPMWQFYADERKKSDERKWRKEYLEILCTRLQFTELRDELFDILDEFKASGNQSFFHDDEAWRFLMHRMDVRGLKPKVDEEHDRIIFEIPDLEPDLKIIHETTQDESDFRERLSRLYLWSNNEFEYKEHSREYYADWREAFLEAQTIAELLNEENRSELRQMNYRGVVITAAVTVRNHVKELNADELNWCLAIILGIVRLNADTDNQMIQADVTGFDGAPAAASVLTLFLEATGGDFLATVKETIALALTHANDTIRNHAANGIRQYLWHIDTEFAQICLNGALDYAIIRKKYLDERQKAHENYYRLGNGKKLSDQPEKRYVSRKLTLRQKVATESLTLTERSVSHETHLLHDLLCAILMIPYDSAEPGHLALFSEIIEIFLDSEAASNDYSQRQDRIELPSQLRQEFPKILSRKILVIQFDKACTVVSNITGRINDGLDLTESILIHLVGYAEQENKIKEYWMVWKEIADALIDVANDEKLRNNEVAYLGDGNATLRNLLLADIEWQRNMTEIDLLRPGVQKVLNFVRSSAENLTVYGALARFLYYFPGLFLPEGLEVLGNVLKNKPESKVLKGRNTVYFLERILQRLLIFDTEKIRKSRNLCDIAQVLLDSMVESGSSSAYFLREHLMRLK